MRQGTVGCNQCDLIKILQTADNVVSIDPKGFLIREKHGCTLKLPEVIENQILLTALHAYIGNIIDGAKSWK